MFARHKPGLEVLHMGPALPGRINAQETDFNIQVGLGSVVHNFTPQSVLGLDSSFGFLLKNSSLPTQ